MLILHRVYGGWHVVLTHLCFGAGGEHLIKKNFCCCKYPQVFNFDIWLLSFCIKIQRLKKPYNISAITAIIAESLKYLKFRNHLT